MNEVLHAARAWRAGGHSAAVGTVVRVKMSAPRLLHFCMADEDAWNVGLPCGGEIDVWVEPYASPEQDAFAQLANELGRGGGRLREARGRIHEVAA